MGLSRFELLTPRLSSVCSNQLSYRPKPTCQPGIPDDALTRVFDPFYTTKERGSGLGLYVCVGIADTHGARLSAENVSTGGARFTVEFP